METMSLSQKIMIMIDMVLTSKEFFLKLVVPKKQAKSLKTILCGVVIKKCYINFLK